MPKFEGEISVDGKNYKIKGKFNFVTTFLDPSKRPPLPTETVDTNAEREAVFKEVFEEPGLLTGDQEIAQIYAASGSMQAKLENLRSWVTPISA